MEEGIGHLRHINTIFYVQIPKTNCPAKMTFQYL